MFPFVSIWHSLSLVPRPTNGLGTRLAQPDTCNFLYTLMSILLVLLLMSNFYEILGAGLKSGLHLPLLTHQRVDTVKDVVFPSRVLRRQLDDAEQRLREMEEELNLIRNREIRERKRKRKMRVSSLIATSFVCVSSTCA